MRFLSAFTFKKEQFKGIYILIALILSLQFLYWYYTINQVGAVTYTAEELAFIQQFHLKETTTTAVSIFPYNPNFITDFKGFQLGLSVSEIDRLHRFRADGKFVNSAAAFQEVTKVSDSLLMVLAPHFKFPDWVTEAETKKYGTSKSIDVVKKDINAILASDLMEVSGIGPFYAEKILELKAKYGALKSLDQLDEIWGMQESLIQKISVYFKVAPSDDGIQIEINGASVKELMRLPYINYKIARALVIHRSAYGAFTSEADFMLVDNFPMEKYSIISMYIIF